MNTFFTKPRKVIMIGLCGLSIATLALAMPDKAPTKRLKVGNYTQFERQYTIPELNTLVQANLLRSPNKSLELKGISKTESGSFNVTITDKQDNKTTDVELNKFGFSINGPMPRLFPHEKQGKWNKKETNSTPKKILSLNEVTEKVQKRLDKLDNKAIKLGTVAANDEGFEVTILAKDDSSLIKRVQLNKAGQPNWKKRFKHKI